MRFTSRSAAAAALADAGLTEFAVTDDPVVDVQVDTDGTAHTSYAKCAAACSRSRWSARQVFDATGMCRTCEPHLVNAAVGRYELASALSGYASIRAAETMIARGRLTAAAGKVLRQVRSAHEDLTGRYCRVPVEARDQLADRAHAAMEGLLALSGGNEARDKALQQCLDAVVPKRLRGKVTPADDDVLIGVYPPMRGTDTTRRVLTALAFATSSSHQMLRGPRYVADYLNREMYRSGDVSLIAVAPVAEASDEQLRAAAALWDPSTGGPVADLRAAVTIAADLHA